MSVQPVLGIDPGTRKFGFAVTGTAGSQPSAKGIDPIDRLEVRCVELIAAHGVRAIVLGAGTNAGPFAERLAVCGVPIHVVDERETTLLARARYFDDHPPRGWLRLVPRGMLLPPGPIDDYAALLIAERYLRSLAG